MVSNKGAHTEEIEIELRQSAEIWSGALEAGDHFEELLWMESRNPFGMPQTL